MMFDADGTELAIAISHTFEEGEREHPKSWDLCSGSVGPWGEQAQVQVSSNLART